LLLLEGDIAAAFMDAVLNLPRVKALLSDEHFSVDGHAHSGVGDAGRRFRQAELGGRARGGAA
jgi:hypothetical protein